MSPSDTFSIRTVMSSRDRYWRLATLIRSMKNRLNSSTSSDPFPSASYARNSLVDSCSITAGSSIPPPSAPSPSMNRRERFCASFRFEKSTMRRVLTAFRTFSFTDGKKYVAFSMINSMMACVAFKSERDCTVDLKIKYYIEYK